MSPASVTSIHLVRVNSVSGTSIATACLSGDGIAGTDRGMGLKGLGRMVGRFIVPRKGVLRALAIA